MPHIRVQFPVLLSDKAASKSVSNGTSTVNGVKFRPTIQIQCDQQSTRIKANNEQKAILVGFTNSQEFLSPYILSTIHNYMSPK